MNPDVHGKVSCIPKTGEQYLSITVGDLVFKDSLAFTLNSLDELVKSLRPEQLSCCRKYIEQYVHGENHEQENLGLYEQMGTPSIDDSCHQMDIDDNDIDFSHTIDESEDLNQFTAYSPPRKRRRFNFLSTEAEVDDFENQDDSDDEDQIAQSDIEFVNDEEDPDESACFYRAIDNTSLTPFDSTSTALSQCDSGSTPLDPCDSASTPHDSCSDQHKGKKYFSIDELPEEDYRRHPYVSPELSMEEQEKSTKLFDLMREKGIFPYEHITSLSVLDETALPSQDCFYSELTQEGVSDEEYKRAKNIWNIFNMRNLWNYHDVYLIMDILLLADVLTNFRANCIKNYQIDPFHSFTVPGFAWQAALKMTGVELDLVSDKDMYLFLESAKRGGVSAISKRYAKCNVPGTENFDPNFKSIDIY